MHHRYTLAATLAVALALPVGLAATRTAFAAGAGVQTAVLGDLTPFRPIAADTLTLVKKGDLPAAEKRATDLETAWDDAEEKLKATDPARWRVVDRAIDKVLNGLRAGKPDRAACETALTDLLTSMDKGGAA